jgi:hypothetical protein
VIAPGTNGYQGREPSVGAYQYGVPAWQAGAQLTSSAVVSAARYSTGTGVSVHTAGNDQVMGNFDGGDVVGYDSVDFGAGRDWFTGSVGSDPSYAGQTVDIHIDSPTGPQIGSLVMISTGGFDTYQTESVPITPTAGVHNVYLVAEGSSPGVGNFDTFTFQQVGGS